MARNERYEVNSVLASNSNTFSMASNCEGFDVIILPQTHIKDIINGNYLSGRYVHHNTLSGQYSPHFNLGSIKLQSCIQTLSVGVGMIAYKRGRGLATGILLTPKLFLTARHALEGISLREVCVAFNFQKSDVD